MERMSLLRTKGNLNELHKEGSMQSLLANLGSHLDIAHGPGVTSTLGVSTVPLVCRSQLLKDVQGFPMIV